MQGVLQHMWLTCQKGCSLWTDAWQDAGNGWYQASSMASWLTPGAGQWVHTCCQLCCCHGGCQLSCVLRVAKQGCSDS
jgi:hypothetical protein